MKNLGIKLLVPALLLGATLTPSIARADKDDHHHPQGVNARLHHQNARIEQGEKNGSLTNREAMRLEAHDARLHAQEARLRHSGDKLSPAERARLAREENRNSRAIYRQKHDAQHRH